jgi:predicted secreted hydrolase
MKQIQYTNSAGVPHQEMKDEFLCHRTGSEWWYCTGFLTDGTDRLFSFQFTLARVRIFGVQFNILMTALSNFEDGKHYYAQQPVFFGKDITITSSEVGLDTVARMTFSDDKLTLNMHDKDYSLSLEMVPVKEPVWHCDNGVLKMGIDGPKETTYYWSYTNLAATGQLVLEGEKFNVTGKSWFDKQGGTYSLTRRLTNWEWFSMRFFDGEEIMLFSFPQDDYRDGTYIEKTGAYQRLTNYKITPLGFTQAGGKKFSNGWKLHVDKVKDEDYTIIPKMEGQLNMFYFELLADIKDKNGQTVGYCVTELLPGVYNKTNPLDAFSRVKV